MLIVKNIPLENYNTFRLRYSADNFVRITNERSAVSLFSNAKILKKPLLILGGGSNVLFVNDFKGTIIHPAFKRIRVEKQSDNYVIISAGAGAEWDKLVEWTVERGFSGLENLSLIPGSVGASPVQNIGAYGVEIKDFIVKVRTISIEDGSIRIFNNEECQFGYRTSIFKGKMKGKYLVTRVYYKLNINPLLNLNYGSLKEEADKLGGATIKNVRQAVINIRSNKLPDPKVTGNAGSFFKNPVIKSAIADQFKEIYPDMPVYNDRIGMKKLAAGWLIEKCGWKGKKIGSAGVHDKQALVLINLGNATGKEIYHLSELIRVSVEDKFGIRLEREVEVTGSI